MNETNYTLKVVIIQMSIENDINDCLISVSVSSVESEIRISIFSVLIVLE